MRVAIDARLLGGTSTGDSTYWTCLVPALLEEDPALELVLVSNAPVLVGGSPFEHARARIVVHPSPGRAFSLVHLPRLAREAGVHLLHVQYAVPPLARLPVVTTIHDVSFLLAPHWFRPRDRVLLTLGARAAARRATRILTVSETSAGEIARTLPAAAGRIDVALNARPPWVVPPPREERLATLARLGIAGPYLLTVGTRWARKNLDLAVAAAELLPADLPHRLVVTGKDGGSAGLGGRGLATGYVANTDLGALYAGADLYLAPSLHEGFGIPLLEAFRCGCPVLATGRGAMAEVAGDAAEMVPPEAEFWASAIGGLLRDPDRTRTLRERGLRRERGFTWAASARATLASYHRALSMGNPA